MTEKLDPNKVNFLYREFHDVPELNEKLSIFPHEISRFAYNALQLQRIQAFIDEENEKGKRTVLIFGHDNDYPISAYLKGSPIVFRYSMSKNHEYQDEYIIPTKVKQFQAAAKVLPKMGWNERPKVSFMGWSGVLKPIGVAPAPEEVYGEGEQGNERGLISPLVFPTPANIGVVLRHQAISVLEKDARIDTEFSIHNYYFYHHSEAFKLQKRQEYIESICNTQYVLTFRGCGNYSIRLFETMSAGRIPVMLNTNQFLPFEDKIPWRELGVWVELNELPKIGDKILERHNGFTEQGFEDAVKNVETIYHDYLSREAALVNIKRILESYL